MTKTENIKDFIYSKDYSFYRGSEDTDDERYIFDRQIDAAKEIVAKLCQTTERSNHVFLIARMQGGKTGTCNAVANIITQTKLYLHMGIDKFMFITGMNDCGLKNQTLQRVNEQIIEANNNNIYTSVKNKDRANRFFVMKNSDLLKYEGDLNNTIIFIDEAHYGSNKNNILTKFLENHNVDWKNSQELISHNTYIVSVSATPFDEIYSDKGECKEMVELKADDNYMGVTDFLKDNRICDAQKDDIESGIIIDYIEDAYERMKTVNKVGVILIRTRQFDTIKNNPYVQRYFNTYEMTSTSSKLNYEEVNDLLKEISKVNQENENKVIKESNTTMLSVKPYIILIKGAFRAGITIDEEYKQYIFMIYDYSLKSDTTAQALLGRMCGYRHKDSENNIYFYINKKFADMYSEWENDITNRALLPYNESRWVWVDKSYSESETKIASRSCGNIAIPLSDEEIKMLYNSLRYKRNKLEIMERIFPMILRNKNIVLPYDYMQEVAMQGKNNYAKSSQKRRFDSFTKDLLVYPFRPEKINKFQQDTNRNYLTNEDVGKRCVSLVLDTTISKSAFSNQLQIEGNKRLLVYYTEVAQKAKVANRNSMYKEHKDTSLV